MLSWFCHKSRPVVLGMRNLWSETRSRGKRGFWGVYREEAVQLGHTPNAHTPGPQLKVMTQVVLEVTYLLSEK